MDKADHVFIEMIGVNLWMLVFIVCLVAVLVVVNCCGFSGCQS